MPGEMKAYRIQSNGVVLYAPGGGGVWNAPTIDPVRNALYFSTGDATTFPSPKTTSGVMAVDIDTGKMLWAYQANENRCNGAARSAVCPDFDIGNSPILKTLSNDKRVLLVGTKSGDVITLDPDNKGAQVYQVSALTGQAPGGRAGGGGRTFTSAPAATASGCFCSAAHINAVWRKGHPARNLRRVEGVDDPIGMPILFARRRCQCGKKYLLTEFDTS